MKPLCILAIVVGIAAGATPQPDTSINAWYTQIGSWHYQKDSVGGKSYIFHNADLDGAASGEATANVRLNKGFDNLYKFIGRMRLESEPSCAGLLVQNKKTTFYFLIKKEKTGDFLQISRRNKMEIASIFVTPVMLPDTFELCLSLTKDSLVIIAGKETASIARPADFSGQLWVGFECPQGTVKVFEAEVASDTGEIKEPFKKATLINLHLEKMFSGPSRKAK
jgi:hypothetical protein